MAYEERDNSGSLFKNDRKTQDNHPEYKGSALIDGVKYWVSSWVKTAKTSGQRFMSLSFERADAQHDRPEKQPDKRPGRTQDTEPLPF